MSRAKGKWATSRPQDAWRRDGTLERADFTYDAENDIYTCPGGWDLKQSRRTFTSPREKKPGVDGMLRYRASKTHCDACELKARCCPIEPSRNILRSIFEPFREQSRPAPWIDADQFPTLHR